MKVNSDWGKPPDSFGTGWGLFSPAAATGTKGKRDHNRRSDWLALWVLYRLCIGESGNVHFILLYRHTLIKELLMFCNQRYVTIVATIKINPITRPAGPQ